LRNRVKKYLVWGSMIVIVAIAAVGCGNTSGSHPSAKPQTPQTPQTQMDRAKALLRDRTGHGDFVCSEDLDYFCEATDLNGADFNNPNTAPCWKVMFLDSGPNVEGPANYYCP
jgi:hypothetical protein